MLGVLRGAELDPLTTFTIHLTVFTFVRGMAMNLELEAEAEASSGLTGDEWMAGQEHVLEALVADGRHPNFARVLGAWTSTWTWTSCSSSACSASSTAWRLCPAGDPHAALPHDG